MAYQIINPASIMAGRGPHPAASPFDKRVGEALGVSAFDMYRVELPAGTETVPHDHLEDRAEDAYAVIRGSGWVIVDGQEVPVGSGDYVAVTVESVRQVRAGQNGLVLIAVCATRG